MATYELWNTSSGNIMGAFETEAAALEIVRKGIAAHGLSYTDHLMLGYEDSAGRSRKIADREELAARAIASGPPRGPVPA